MGQTKRWHSGTAKTRDDMCKQVDICGTEMGERIFGKERTELIISLTGIQGK